MQSLTLKFFIVLLISLASNNIIAQVKATQANSSFLVISDMHLDAATNKQEKVGKDDSGKELWYQAKCKIKRLLLDKKPEFMVVLGDLPSHTLDSAKRKEYIDSVLKDISDSIGVENSNIPIIFVPGNNDSQNGDYGSYSVNTEYNYPTINLGTTTDLTFPRMINDSLRKAFGCFSVYPINDNKLRIIILNTVMFSNDSRNPYKYDTATCMKQLRWFEDQLTFAKNEKVLIAMHIPPGIDGFPDKKSNHEDLWFDLNIQNRFLKDVAENPNIIGLLASHSHMDGIRLLHDTIKDTITSLLISVPGIAPGHGNNPGMKIITYNPVNYELEDFTTFYTKGWEQDGGGWNFKADVPWADSLNFKNEFRNNSNLSMVEYLKKAIKKGDLGSIKTYNQKIYFVGSGNKQSNNPDTTILVRSRQP